MKPPRVKTLQEAARLTAGNRDKSYGPPSINMDNIAQLWTAYLAGKYAGRSPGLGRSEFQLTGEDVAHFNALQKMARTFAAYTPDNYIDAAAYAAIAGECREEDEQE